MQQDFAALLERSFETELKPTAIVLGEVLKLDRDGLRVDIGGKSEGYVPMKEIPGCFSLEELKNAYHLGQMVECFIMNDVDDDEVQYTLSIRRVMMSKNWDRLSIMKEAGEIVETTVTGVTKGGVIVNIFGFKGFIPASQLRVAKTLNELVGDTLPTKILEVDRKKNKLILSHREAIFEQKAEMRARTIASLTEGDVVNGHVVKITDFGAFVDINGIDGLLPLSEITWRRIQHPSEVLELGQALTVRVLTVDRNLQRISLSLKRLESDPWDTVNTRFHVGEQLVGKVSKMLGSGILAELIPGVEAYCAYQHGGKFYQVGESYSFEIVSISADERRITLEYRGEA